MTRLATISALIAASLFLIPSTSHAESCGGDSGGSGGSGGSDGGHDDSDSEPACDEVSQIVGHSVCTKFGSWNSRKKPPLRFQFGTSIIKLGSPISASGRADHPGMPQPVSYVVQSLGESSSFSGGSFDLAITTRLSRSERSWRRHLYAGFEGRLGGLSSSGMTVDTSDSDGTNVEVDSGGAMFASAAAIIGVRAPLGSFVVRGEIAAGVETVGLVTTTRHQDCEHSKTEHHGAYAVRPRVSVERWMTPWLSLGASVGSNLLSREDATFGLYLGAHVDAFDGGR